MEQQQCLLYNKPADMTVWEEGLPLGNGSFGAMAFGGVGEATYMLNQDSVWFGGRRERINPDAKDALTDIRQLLFQGELEQAEWLAYHKMFGTPFSQGHYEPLADLKIIFAQTIPHYSEWNKERVTGYENYERRLELKNALYHISYQLNGTVFNREAFISYPDKVMAIRLTTEENTPLSMIVELNRWDNCEAIYVNHKNRLILEGTSGGGGNDFVAMVAADIEGGTVARTGASLDIKDATVVTLYVTGQTSFYEKDPLRWCEEQLNNAVSKGYETIKKDHLDDYRSLYDTVQFSLEVDSTIAEGKTEHEKNTEAEVTPDQNSDLKKRLSLYREGMEDLDLYPLYFNYGRYLLIASSRAGSLPANLQGIWNKDMQPPWGCKYTININTQMNYWLADVGGLSSCHTPLFDHLQRMLPRGKRVAKDMYDCRGFVAHHNTDIFGDCAPQDQWMPATIWPMGAAWLCLHIIDHYHYTMDKKFVRKYMNVVEEASLFFIDFLIEDKTGRLVTSPSTSPENTYLLDNGQKSALCYGPTMDSQIVRALWQGYLELCDAVGHKSPVASEIAKRLQRLPATTLDGNGRVMEWSECYEEWEPGHRHISHLFGLYPGNEIDKKISPELFEGARKTLAYRLKHGGGHTGWSRAWIINLYARLEEKEKAYENLQALLRKSTADNLFDMHPPFQIDGNFGSAAGILEMLVQSHNGRISLLPALPKAWPNGKLLGVCLRGGIKANIEWESGKPTVVSFYAEIEQSLVVTYKEAYVLNLKAEQWTYMTFNH